jgi:phosphopantothenoylcysteine decarboxylase / phosphopantothenate---cysteine ligase
MRIVVGVSGGIAAYKAAELVRALQERAHTVQVVMTAHAQEFVRPLTFAALTGQKVITGMFGSTSADETLASAIEHIGVAQQAEALVVAPATAGILAKFAHGIADDFLTTLHLAFTGPVVVAPAMNVNMWQHPATQANLETLTRRGVRVVEPGEGYLACGMTGPGRMAEPERIVAEVERALMTGCELDGRTVLITAGPTREPLDPVRYLSNRSSGRMGFALAEEALARGARVVLVAGPTALEPPARAELFRVETADQMRQAVLDHLAAANIIIKAAAVADFRPVWRASTKLKKAASPAALNLEPTPDILAELGRIKGDRILVGFAAETENLREEALRKLRAKNCDLLVANPVGQPGTGFDSEDNIALLVTASGEVTEFPRGSKRALAARVFDVIHQLQPARR